MMKSFSTVRDIWRGTPSYMEKRRGRRELEVTRRRRGGIKGERASQKQSVHYVLSAVWTSQRCSWSYTEKRRGMKETEVIQEDKRGTQKETDPATQFPKCSPQPRTHKEIYQVGQRRKGGGGRQRRLGKENRESKGRESNQASDLSSK